MNETQFTARVIETAQWHGWHCAHFRPAKTDKGWRTPMQGDRGFPDLALARNGVVILAELKTDRGDFGHGQREWLDACGPHGRLWRPSGWEAVLDELSTPTTSVHPVA